MTANELEIGPTLAALRQVVLLHDIKNRVLVVFEYVPAFYTLDSSQHRNPHSHTERVSPSRSR